MLGPSTGTASLSPCGQYRWWLERVWQPAAPRLLFIGLNPSPAVLRRAADPVGAETDGWLRHRLAAQPRHPLYVDGTVVLQPLPWHNPVAQGHPVGNPAHPAVASPCPGFPAATPFTCT